MGVNIAHYVVLGDFLPNDGSITYEKCEPFLVSYWEPRRTGFGVLYDGMSGDYIIAGKILAATGNNKDFFSENPTKFIISDEDKNSVKREIKERLGVECKRIGIMAVTHHT